MLIAIALAGLASHKNLISIMLGIELIFLASIVVLVSFFDTAAGNPSAVIALFSIWSVLAAEIIALIAFYVYLKYKGVSFDLSKLSKMKW